MGFSRVLLGFLVDLQEVSSVFFWNLIGDSMRFSRFFFETVIGISWDNLS